MSDTPQHAAPGGQALIGTRQRRHDGARYVTGRARYTDDLRPAGALHVALVRSPHPHARIVAIDAAAAVAAASVHLVLDGEEIAARCAPIRHNLDPAGLGGHHADVFVLAREKVIYVGEPVAAVVADTAADAMAAAELVEVTYEMLPAVLDADAALEDGAPLIYQDWGSNLMIGGPIAMGDFEAAAAEADHVGKGEVRLGRMTAAPMEMRVYHAEWDARARHLRWTGTTQNPHQLRKVLAEALHLGEHDVTVVAPTPGGAFGLKMHGHAEEVLVGALSRELNRPVTWSDNRADTQLWGAKQLVHRFRYAYDDDGRVRGLATSMVADHGVASAGPGWGMAFAGSLGLPGGYDIDNVSADYRVAVTNKAPWWGVRPFGKEAITLLMERIMDLVAGATGLDPLEVRRRNWIEAEDFPHSTPTGLLLDSGNYRGLADLLEEHVDREALRAELEAGAGARTRIGLGLGFELMPEGGDIPGALVSTYDTATLRMDPSGHATLLTGVTTPGGGSDTGLAMLVADRLGLPVEEVSVIQGDTDTCPYGFGNLSSRSIVSGGGATLLAADELARRLRTYAADMLHLEAGEAAVELQDGMARVAGVSEQAVPIAAVAHAAHTLGYVLGTQLDEPLLEVTRTYKPPNIRHQPNEQHQISPFTSMSNALHLAVCEVDLDTGVVRLVRHVGIHDCGTMVNPLMVEGQFEGGIAMGIGAALMEELLHDAEGRPRSEHFKSYLLPRAVDVPHLEVLHQQTPSPFTMLGAKGGGESGYAGALAAVVNAVNDALRREGVRLDQVPLTPDRVLDALAEAGA
jgi:carbon-monoxide dehydrogenase large subunit